MHMKIQGIIPVMLTPFDEYGNIDWDSQKRLIEWYLKQGCQSLVRRLPIIRNAPTGSE